MSIRVIEVDPFDDEAVAAYHDTFVRAFRPGRVDPRNRPLHEVRVILRAKLSSRKQVALVALDGDRPVGVAELIIPLADNTNLLIFDLAVLPEERRRGAGAAILAAVRAYARQYGRTLLETEVHIAIGTESQAPGPAFLSKRGLTLRNSEFRNQLRLPVPDHRLDELATKAREKTRDFRIIGWVDHCPEEYAEQYAHLRGLLVSEAPSGDLELERENWSVERLREQESLRREQGHITYTAAAAASDGTLAGHTLLIVPPGEERRALQGDTLVLSEHRGHRLGLACKVSNLRAALLDHPDLTRVDTYNDDENAPMMAVNRDLGFRAIELCQQWQGGLR